MREEFGASSLDFIAILITLVVVGITIYAGGKSGFLGYSILIAVGEINVLLLFFTAKGWLSGWYLFVLVLAELLIGFILWMSGGSTD
jgi:hypothetical protein